MLTNSAIAQRWLIDSDTSHARELRHWLEEELSVSIDQVLSIDIQSDMIEQSPDGQYKRFKLGKFNCFMITLTDGNKLYRSFRRGA